MALRESFRIVWTIALMEGVLLSAPWSLCAQDGRYPGDKGSVIDSAVRSGDFAQAAASLEESAQSGDVEAQYQVAALYRLGAASRKTMPLPSNG
jgi:hypothetical protein